MNDEMNWEEIFQKCEEWKAKQKEVSIDKLAMNMASIFIFAFFSFIFESKLLWIFSGISFLSVIIYFFIYFDLIKEKFYYEWENRGCSCCSHNYEGLPCVKDNKANEVAGVLKYVRWKYPNYSSTAKIYAAILDKMLKENDELKKDCHPQLLESAYEVSVFQKHGINLHQPSIKEWSGMNEIYARGMRRRGCGFVVEDNYDATDDIWPQVRDSLASQYPKNIKYLALLDDKPSDYLLKGLHASEKK